MKKLVPTVSILSLFFLVITAQAEIWTIGIGVGSANIDFDSSPFSDGSNPLISATEISTEASLAYQFSRSAYAKVSYAGYANIAFPFFEDPLEYDSFRVGIGYRWRSENPVSLFAEAGASFWNLEANENPIFNPGTEEQVELKGTDYFVQAGADYHFSDKFSLGLAADYENNDFGSVSGIKLMGRFSF